VAEELGIGEVLVPPHAGVLSAMGLLMSDYVHYRSLTRRVRVTGGAIEKIRTNVFALQGEIRDYLDTVGITAAVRYECALEMRYVGQAFEVSVPLTTEDLPRLDAQGLIARFGVQHHRVFEFSKPHDDPVELISIRVGARAAAPPMPDRRWERAAAPAASDPIALLDRGERLRCQRLGREHLTSDPRPGPCLLDDGTSTIYVPPRWRASIDAHGNVAMKE